MYMYIVVSVYTDLPVDTRTRTMLPLPILAHAVDATGLCVTK